MHHVICSDHSLQPHCLGREGCPREYCASEPGTQGLQAYEKGDHLFRTGDVAEFLFVIRSGAIKTYLISADGEEQILGFHMPGDILGFDAVSAGSFPGNAVALKTTTVCRLPRAAIFTPMPGLSVSQEKLINSFSQEIQRLQGVLSLERCNAEQRLAKFLLDLSHKQEALGRSARYVSLPMSRGEIGKFLDLATETVSRMFTRLVSMGLIGIDRGVVEILDPRGLLRLRQDCTSNNRPQKPGGSSQDHRLAA